MAGYGLGTMPETSFAEAADVIGGETGDYRAVPVLPARGVYSTLLARSVALLTDVAVSLCPQGWRVDSRPQRATHRLWDVQARDLDVLEEAWAAHKSGAVKFTVLGPWSLLAQLRSATGRISLRDHGFRRDAIEALAHGYAGACEELGRRFPSSRVVLQLDEPFAWRVAAGTLTPWSIVDPIRAIGADEFCAAYEHFASAGAAMASTPIGSSAPAEVLINLVGGLPIWSGTGSPADGAAPTQVASTATATLWRATRAADGVVVAPRETRSSAMKDHVAEHLDSGKRLTVATIEAGDALDEAMELPRRRACEIAEYVDELRIPREALQHVDVAPHTDLSDVPMRDAARALAVCRVVASMLSRDAGDL